MPWLRSAGNADRPREPDKRESILTSNGVYRDESSLARHDHAVRIIEPSMQLSAGARLAHYEILSLLGRGGMGEVYRATDLKLGREVALKVLPPETSNERIWLDRFEREAKSLAALDHPGIVTVFSVEESEGVRFLTMQLVAGRNLCQVGSTSGLPPDRVIELAIPLADALAAAHDK